jgi:hypothetical protein
MTSNSYIFRVSDVLVHNCRSKGDHNDSDWMHLVVTINDQVQEPTGLFNIGDNIHAGDELHGPWDVGPYLISDQDKVIVTLMVENLSHTNTAQQIGEAIKVGTLIVAAFGGVASALSKATAAIKLNAILAGVIGTAGEVLGWIVGESDPNCNGEILSQPFFFDRGELAQRAPFTIPNEYTSRSPSECGNDPHTHLSFMVLPMAPPPRVTHEFLAGVNADHTIQVFQFTPAGGWTTGRIGWASVAGPLTSWVAGGTWHLAGLGTDGNVYVLWQSPGHDWQAANISAITASRVKPPMTAWLVNDVEHLAGLDAAGQPVVFWWSPAHDWQATKMTTATGQPIGDGLQSWIIPI